MVTVERELAPLRAEWDALADRAGASPFTRPGWVLPWFDAFGDGELELVTLRRDGRLAGALPVVRSRGRLRSPTNDHTPVYDPIPAIGADAAELLRGAYALGARAIELAHLGPAPETAALACEASRVAGRRTVSRTLIQPPYVPLEQGFEAFEAGLPRKRRKELRRQWRRLAETGDLTFDVGDASDDLHARLDEVFAVEDSGWKAERGTAIASHPHTRRFYTRVAEWAAERGWLRLPVLRLDGRAVAVDYALECEGVWYALKGGYDPQFGSFGPGILLLYRTLEHAFGAGLHRFDLLGEPDPYKLDWAGGRTERAWVAAFASSPAGQAGYSMAAARERARPYLRRVRRGVRGRLARARA